MKKIIAAVLALTISLSLAACGGSDAASSAAGSAAAGEDAKRVACIMTGPISDMSWNYTAHQGLLKIEKMGAEIAYQENVDNSALADCINTYASEGFDVIFLTDNAYEETALPIVKDYPDTQFVIINGQTTEGNVASYAVADEEQGFLQGVICAAVSESDKVGFVAAMEITPMLNGQAGFEQGAKYVNENAEVTSVMIGSFTDVAAAKETTNAMITAGVDAVAPMCDSAALGVVEAAEEGGIYAAASGEGQDTIAPNAVLCAVIKDTSVVFENAYQDYLDGEMATATGVQKMGAKDGVVFLSDWFQAADNISDDVKAEIESAYDALVAGEVTITLD